MTKGRSDTNTQSTPPSMAGRFRWLLGIVIVVVAAYSAFWFWLSGQVKTGIETAIANAAANGQTVACDGRSVTGYPFRMGVDCAAMSFAAPQSGVNVATGAFRTTALVHRPELLIAELDAPITLETPTTAPLRLLFDDARASVRIAQPLPERLSVLVDAPTLSYRDLGGPPLASAASIEAHLRTRDTEAVDIALNATGLNADNLPTLTATADLAWDAGDAIVALLQSRDPAALRGSSGEIRQITLTPADGGSVTLAGPVSFDAAGLTNGDLTVTITEGAKLADALRQIGPRFGADLTPFADMLAAAPAGSAPITVSIRDGQARIGFIPLGTIPPL